MSHRKRFWFAVHLVLWLTCAGSLAGMIASRSERGELLWLLPWLAAFGLLFATMRRFVAERNANRRDETPRADEVLEGRRDYGIYLRSFLDERALQRKYRRAYPTEEERIVAAFRDYAEVVAISDPAAESPVTGPSTIGAGGDWKQRLEQLLPRAAFVLLRLGTSPGVAWELSYVLRNVSPTRIILLTGLKKQPYAHLSRSLAEEFEIHLPPHTGTACVVTFDEGWKPTPYLLKAWALRASYRQTSLETSLRAALTPFLRRLGYSAEFLPLSPAMFLHAGFSFLAVAALTWGFGAFPILLVMSGAIEMTLDVGIIGLALFCALASCFSFVLFVRMLVDAVQEVWFPASYMALRSPS